EDLYLKVFLGSKLSASESELSPSGSGIASGVVVSMLIGSETSRGSEEK
ncbi:hypothetical protein A2U01_0103756, partial [Trifolium medium]|nr:hypothetical protein [Trifolium medium]